MSIRSWPQRDCGARLQTFAALPLSCKSRLPGESNKIISQEMAGKMLTPGTGNWGLGMGLGAIDGRKRKNHSATGEVTKALSACCSPLSIKVRARS